MFRFLRLDQTNRFVRFPLQIPIRFSSATSSLLEIEIRLIQNLEKLEQKRARQFRGNFVCRNTTGTRDSNNWEFRTRPVLRGRSRTEAVSVLVLRGRVVHYTRYTDSLISSREAAGLTWNLMGFRIAMGRESFARREVFGAASGIYGGWGGPPPLPSPLEKNTNKYISPSGEGSMGY